jgi:phosphoribosylcarboxyaminoimidazole (NCAIR) mutase
VALGLAVASKLNAALLAIQILAVEDEGLALKLAAARAKASAEVLKKDLVISEKY